MSSNYPVINKATDQNAVDVPTDTTSFNNRLSSSDVDVQTALETLDDHVETGSSTTLDTSLFNGILSATQNTVQKAFDWIDDLLKRSFVFNPDNTDIDFTINKNTSGEAYKYDAGTDEHTFNGDITSNDASNFNGAVTMTSSLLYQPTTSQSIVLNSPVGATSFTGFAFRKGNVSQWALDNYNDSLNFYNSSLATDWFVISQTSFNFNASNRNVDFIIGADSFGEAYKYDAGLGTHTFSAFPDNTMLTAPPTGVNPLAIATVSYVDAQVAVPTVNTIHVTSTTETVDISSVGVIRQTASGITTSLSNVVSGSTITIINDSGGNNTLNITFMGAALPILQDKESITMTYNGTDWDGI